LGIKQLNLNVISTNNFLKLYVITYKIQQHTNMKTILHKADTRGHTALLMPE